MNIVERKEMVLFSMADNEWWFDECYWCLLLCLWVLHCCWLSFSSSDVAHLVGFFHLFQLDELLRLLIDRSSSALAYVHLYQPTEFSICLSFSSSLKFVDCSFVSCAIWQYESHRAKLLEVKQRWTLKDKPKKISSQVRQRRIVIKTIVLRSSWKTFGKMWPNLKV